MQEVQSVGAFSLAQVYWYVIVYILAQGVNYLFTRFTPWYSESDTFIQRNCVCYVLEVLITFPVLVMQVYYGWTTFHEEYPSQGDSNMIIFASVMLVSLYLFEIGYKSRIGAPLLAHHLITVTFIMLAFWRMVVEPRIFVLKGAILMGMTATTEQQSFIALFFYRVKYFSLKTVSYMFYFSAVSTFVVKTILIGFTTDSWARNSTLFWWILYPPLMVGLFVTQVWGAWILWKLGDRLMSKYKASLNKDEEQGENKQITDVRMVRRAVSLIKTISQRSMTVEEEPTITMHEVDQDIENMSKSYY